MMEVLRVCPQVVQLRFQRVKQLPSPEMGVCPAAILSPLPYQSQRHLGLGALTSLTVNQAAE